MEGVESYPLRTHALVHTESFVSNTGGMYESAPSVTTASTADTWNSSSATMYVPYVATMVSVISAMGVLYM